MGNHKADLIACQKARANLLILNTLLEVLKTDSDSREGYGKRRQYFYFLE